jgi:prevent-host-death family protein
MFIDLRDAKRRLSELVKLAAEGKVILITVRGEPIVKLTNAVSSANLEDRETWVDELTEAAERETVGSPVATTQDYWELSRLDG